MLEEPVCRVIIDSRFEITIFHAPFPETGRGTLQEFLPDMFSPVRRVNAQIKDLSVRCGTVFGDSE